MPVTNAPFRAMEDRELVIAFKAGEPGAYDEMYRRYSARVGGVCRRMLANRDDAQEALQETFLKAYVGLPEFNGNYRLGAWLGRIASNVCVDLIRAKARSASVVPLQADAGVLAVERSPEEVVVGDGPEVAQQMGEIQPLHARALMLRGVEGLSHREIATKLSMTPGQVKALLHRARKSFKRNWDEAKGWALAPLVLLRGTSRQLRSASQAGSQIAGATATVGPVLAERVAASAMIVAVALTGFPQPSLSTRPEAARTFRRAPQTNEWQLKTQRAAYEGRSAVSTKPSSSRPRTVTDSVRARQRLLPSLQKVLERTQGTVGQPPKESPEDKDEPGLVPLGPKSAGKTAEKVAEDVEDLLPEQ